MQKKNCRVLDDLSFNDVDTFDDQLQTFLKKVLLTDEEFSKYYFPVMQDILKIFKCIFPRSKVYIFGSTHTYLGFKDCDLDLFLYIGSPVIEKEITSGPNIVSLEKLFTLIEKVLFENKDVFKRIIPIPKARIPIVKFQHIKTHTHCDLSFKNFIGLYNSELIHYYISLDERFKQLIVILRYWIKRTKKKLPFTQYTLSVLVIFYLQQIKLVPTVSELQKKCPISVTVNGWQVNFQEIPYTTTSHYKNRCLPEILQDFFEFYKNYDFNSYVICPFDGQSHDKNSFMTMKKFPSSRKNDENTKQTNLTSTWNSKICVQDPIELNINLTKTVSSSQLKIFQDYLFFYANVVKDSVNHHYKTLLKNLFDNSVDTKKPITPVIENFSFSLQLEQFFCANLVLDFNQIYSNWFDLTFKMIRQYLKEVLKFDIEIERIDGSIKEMEEEVQLSCKQVNLILYCKGKSFHMLQSGRKELKIQKQMSPLEKEIEISKLLLVSRKTKNDEWDGTEMNFKCIVTKKMNSEYVIILTLVNGGCTKKQFNSLSNHLKAYMTSVIRKNFKYLKHEKLLVLN